MVSAERIRVTLIGGAPWGFRLSGGGALPLTINKIRKKSSAHVSGLKEGDAVISINGIPVHDKSQDEALELVEKSGDTLKLEIFRGDMDELSRDKPKKTIFIGGGGGGGVEGGLVLTATVDDVSSASNIVPQPQDTSEIILTTVIGDITSDALDTPESEMGGSHGFTATLGDVSESSFDNAPSGFTITASDDDITSSSIMVDSISAEIGDLEEYGVILVPEMDLQATSSSPSLAQPFTDSHVISVSPSHLSPLPPRGSLSPKPVSLSPKPVSLSPKPVSLSPKPVAFSPKPQTQSLKSPVPTLSPKSPVTPIQNPTSPSFTATSPKPVSFSPKPGLVQPIVQNKSPKPFQSAPPPTSPKPSTVSSTTATSHEIFDDGQGHIKREVVVTAQKESNVSYTKVGPSFVKHQASAFDAPSPNQKTTSVKAITSITSTTTNRKGPVPFSASANQLDNNANISPAITSSPSTGKIHPLPPTRMFKPSKFTMGQGKKDVPGLYAPGSPKVDVSVFAQYKDGKENQQPMFQVKNNVGDKGRRTRDVWKPNVWLPGQQEQVQRQQQQPQTPSVADDFSPYSSFPVPQLQSGVSLMEPRQTADPRLNYDMGRYNGEEYDEVDALGRVKRPSKLHIFAPPVEIHAPEDSGYPESPYSPYLPYREDGEIDVGYHYEGLSSPDSSGMRKKNLYADSAFYDTPGKSYPTINEQMKLCKIIASSLTSQANRRARGAKMFMKRRRKSNKWIHTGQSEWSSSAGDVANILDLESELSVDEGGSKPLFYFKIPNLKNRISSADRKMALTQEQFERLRLQSHKCDHKVVPPTTCFDIVADLKASKGKGGRMFEKRKVRVEKYVVDEKNARHAPQRVKLENALNKPVRQEKTPWEAAIQHGGNVDAAFSHIDEMERNQKLSQVLKYPQAKKLPDTPIPKAAPMTPMTKTSLRADSTMMLRGKDFNRTARGWGGGGDYPVADQIVTIPVPAKRLTTPSKPVAPPANTQPYKDYNPKIKAWQSPGRSPYVTSSSPAQAPQSQPTHWGQHSWHADVQRPQEHSERWRSQDDLQARSRYKDEIDYTYVPVDYKFSEDYQSPAYKQPIIPGTDL